MKQHERLRQYNRWRRGKDDWAPDERGPDPKELGELIDDVADRLEALECEQGEKTMIEYETLTATLVVKPKGASIFSERATRVEIDDESAGPFIVVKQEADGDEGKIGITADEWPAIRQAIDEMIDVCRRMETDLTR